MDGKSLHMTDSGVLKTIFGLQCNFTHSLHIVKIIVQMLWIYQRILLEIGINVPEISDALKYYKSQNKLRQNHYDYILFTQSLTEVYINQQKKVYTKFT